MIIEFKNINFEYIKNKNVLKDINFSVSKKEIIFVMGKNGSGKSTLMQNLNLLLKPKSGTIKYDFKGINKIIDGKKKIKDTKEIRREFGFLFQFPEYQLFETSVIKDVEFGIKNFFKDSNDSYKRAFATLKNLDVDENLYEKSPLFLSGGEKRKVAICGILSYEPSLLIFDEPTCGLDYKSEKDFLNLILNLKGQKTIFIISHDFDLSYKIADKILFLEDGKIKYFDETKKVLQKKFFKENKLTPFLLELEETFDDLSLNKIIKEIRNE